MPEIKFNRDYKVKDEHGNEYKEGQVVKGLNQASCDHFVSRGAAGYYDAKAEKAAKAAAKAEKEAAAKAEE